MRKRDEHSERGQTPGTVPGGPGWTSAEPMKPRTVRGTRNTWRVLGTELRRGAAPVMLVLVLLGMCLALYDMLGSWGTWPGRWMPFATAMRMTLWVTGGVIVAVAAWQGGRERRRRLGDQLASASRPSWQQVTLSWASVTLGAFAGLVIVVAAGTALVAPAASYAGGGWWWVLAATFPAVAALAALGFALGRMVPSWLVAPVAAIVTYGAMVMALDSPDMQGVSWLFPVFRQADGYGFRLDFAVSATQMVWFAALSVTVLVLAGARRRWLAAIPASVAGVAGVTLIALDPAWEPDPAALEPVCTEDGPEVCLARVNAYLMDDLAGPTQEVLRRWEMIPGGPERADDALRDVRERPDASSGRRTLEISVATGQTLTGGLGDRPLGDLYFWWPSTECGYGDVEADRRSLVNTAITWAHGPTPWMDGETRERYEGLLALPEDEQVAWVSGVIEAVTSCDMAALDELKAEGERW